MGMESKHGMTTQSTRDFIKMGKRKEKGSIYGQMAQNTMGIG